MNMNLRVFLNKRLFEEPFKITYLASKIYFLKSLLLKKDKPEML